MFTPIAASHRRKHKIARSAIFFIIFFFTIHFTPSVYINSGFLSTWFNESSVGFIYAISSTAAILTILLTRKFLPVFGNYRMFINILILEAFALTGFIFGQSQLIIILSFILNFVCLSLAYMHADVFLESSSDDSSAGATRGLSLTFINLAFVLGPILASILTRDDSYWRVYVFGLIFLIPTLAYAVYTLKDFEEPEYTKTNFVDQFKKIIHDRDVFFALLCAFILRVFYSWMVIYLPIYLIKHLGFEVSETSLIIGLGLIPFVLLEYALGVVADKYIGEKELMSLGFVIMSLSTMAIVFVPHEPILWIWIVIMFVSRVGASMVEIMTETYLFKKIDVSDLNTMSFFRTLQPLAYIVSPLVATFALSVFGDIRHLFIILGIYLLFGLRYSLALHDTK